MRTHGFSRVFGALGCVAGLALGCTIGGNGNDEETGPKGDSAEGGDDPEGTTGPATADPEAIPDACYMAQADAMLVVDASEGVLRNDRDPDGDPLSILEYDEMSTYDGTVSMDLEGGFTYAPAEGMFGGDSFEYTVEDGQGGRGTAMVQIWISPVRGALSWVAEGAGGLAIDGEASGDRAGAAVSAAGDVNGDGLDDIVLGAEGSDATGNDAGRAYVVFGRADLATIDLTEIAGGTGGFVIDGEAAGAVTGTAVGGHGDVNGDGLSDLVIGASQANGGAGGAYVVFGKADTGRVALSDVASGQGGFAIAGEVEGDRAGASVALVGDLDDDGMDDIAIGAPEADPAGEASGRVYVVFGTSDASPISLADIAAGSGGFVLDGEGQMERAGISVRGGGDIDGDGRADLLVGASGATPNGNNAGRIYVVFGRSETTPLPLSQIAEGAGGFVLDGTIPNELAGTSVASAGDVDGDGLDDILVGAIGADAQGDYTGRAYLVFGKPDTEPVALADVAQGIGGFALEGEAADDAAGRSVAAAGDIDGDGLADLLIGAHGSDPFGDASGRAYVLTGQPETSPASLSSIVDASLGFVLEGEAAYDNVGRSLDGVGDFNGDGLVDLAIAAHGHAQASNLGDAGRVYVVLGTPVGMGCSSSEPQ